MNIKRFNDNEIMKETEHYLPNKYFAAACFLNMFKDSLTKTVCLKVFCNLLCKYRPEHPMPIPRNPAMPISVWLEGHFIVTNLIHLIFTVLFLVSKIFSPSLILYNI